MTVQLDIQFAVQNPNIPTVSKFEFWATQIPATDSNTSACLRIVDEDEGRELNKRYRNINKATNVLSFPADIPKEHELSFLGDIVICAPIVITEAKTQGKNLDSHWAHLLVHGILHLQGYTHDNDKQAKVMEALEIKTLQRLGMENPY